MLKSLPGQEFLSRNMLNSHPLEKSYVMNALTEHCKWKDQVVSEKDPHRPFDTEAENNEVADTYCCFSRDLYTWKLKL